MGLPASLPGPLPQEAGPATPILSASPLVSFATTRIDPPAIVYVGLEDSVHVSVWNSLAGAEVDVTTRLLRADGQVITNTTVIKPTANRVRNDNFLQLAEGFILSIAVTTPTVGMLRGMCWCNVHIADGNTVGANDTQPLFSDYITSSETSGWPGGRQISSVEGPGLMVVTALANPAPGATLLVTPPANTRWRILGIVFTLSTSVAAAVRRVYLLFLGGAGNLLLAAAATTQAASLTYTYRMGDYGQPPTDFVPDAVWALIPRNTFLSNSVTAAIYCFNVQAADQFGGGVVFVEEWLEPTA